MEIRNVLLATAAAAVLLSGCGGGDGGSSDRDAAASGPRLSALAVTTSAHNGETLEPAFDPEVRDYTLRVQSDIYGVLLQPKTEKSDLQTSVNASITAGAYSTSNPNTDVNAPEAVPLAQTYGNSGHMVKLSQSYAAFDVAFTQVATVTVADTKTEKKSQYKITIVRDNDSAIRQKFGAEKVFNGSTGASIKYRIYFPPNYATSGKSYPVVLALHGVGQRAAGGQPSDMLLKRTKQATIWAQDSEADSSKEAIVIAPQANTAWVIADNIGSLAPHGQAAYELLQSVIAGERVNKSRVYLTGLSMGGNGSLVMAETYPETFAGVFLNAAWAGLPNSDTVLGTGYNWSGMKQHLDGRIRIVAAQDDPDVQHKSYLNLLNQLTMNGINFQSKLYPTGTFFSPTAHFVWIAGYADKTTRDWMFSLSKQNLPS